MITVSQLHTIVADVVEAALGRNVHGHTRRGIADDLAAALEDALPDDLLHDEEISEARRAIDESDADEPDAA